MKTRRTLAALMLGFSFALSAPLHASGIPTFDDANLADRAVKFAQEMKEMAEQFKMLQNQLTEMKEQTALMRGVHGVGRAVAEDFKNSIPDEWSEIYTQIGNIDIEPLSKQKYDAERGTKLLVKNIDVLEKALQDTQKGFADLDKLLDEVNKTQSMKAAADLQNRIAIQQARINNNHTKLVMLDKMLEMQAKAAEVRDAEFNACIYRHHGNVASCQ